MERSQMTLSEMGEKLVKWAVTDVYNKWEEAALNASIKAHKYASARAAEESDARSALVNDFLETLVKVQELVREETFKDLLVYTPEDMR